MQATRPQTASFVRNTEELAPPGVRSVLSILLALLACGASVWSAEIDFVRDIQPLFRGHCFQCHGPEKQKAGLRLDSRESVFEGGDSHQPAIIPKSSAESRLVELVSAGPDADLRMPPKGEMLKAEEVARIRKWIDEGADWPASASATALARAEMIITETDRNHWAFAPLRTTNLSQLLKPTDTGCPQDVRRVLIRRLYFDLVGLPPTPEEIAGFDADCDPGAYAHLVDRLLASKHYGERWGRHWLDLARYADSDGYEADRDRPEAWPYRDWVIRALNADLPFDQFVRWQIAGDECEPNHPDAVVA